MKNFFLLVTIILSFNLSAQYKFSGSGVYLTYAADALSITVKWTSSTNNQVVTKSANFATAQMVVNFQQYAQYKVKNSTDYFLIKPAILGDGFSIKFYNELGSLYWETSVFRD